MFTEVTQYIEHGGAIQSESALPDFVVVGPTASGKSAFALWLAERTESEIVGCDAFQVYQEVPILTAQPSAEDAARVPHHLIGVRGVCDLCDAGWYGAEARNVIADIHARGRRAIVVGGTGFYLRSLLEGLPSEMPAGDEVLRRELEGLPLDQLVAEVRAMDPEASAVMDLKNPRRVIRAVEVIRLTGRPFSSFRQNRSSPQVPGICLAWEREELWSRIIERTDAMFELGVVDEVSRVRDHARQGAGVRQAIGFREILEMIDGERTQAACREALVIGTRQYAKRQATWFRGQSSFAVVSGQAACELVARG
jgi:tRNA dimethylallyltransferase